ncbi:zinc ribbon domain-containing protein [Radiobacillus deserti]|nr:zinc ribbon domain-containing protein [Radiobacillus deserti]
MGYFLPLIQFTIILFTVFLVVRQINRLRKPDQNPMDSMIKKECPYCITSIAEKAIKCPSCGSDLENFPRNQSIPAKQQVKLRIK